MLVVPQEGEQQILRVLFGQDPPEVMWLKLYVNVKTPIRLDSVASFREMTSHGYEPRQLNPSDWSVRPGHPSEAVGRSQSWVFQAEGQPVNVYGYFLVGVRSGRLYWAERFTDGPYTVEFDGDKITVEPRQTVQSRQQGVI